MRKIPIRVGASLFYILLLINTAFAGAAVDYSKQPKRYLNRSQTVSTGFCFFDPPDYVCVGKDRPYAVIARSIPAGLLKSSIDEKCSGLDAAERNPNPDCRYGFRFVPTRFKNIVSDYAVRNRLRRDAKIVEFRADVLEPLKILP